MNVLEQLLVQVQGTIEKERDLDNRLNALEDIAASIEPTQAPELVRITLVHSNLVRAELERSRRLWVKLATLSGILLAGTALLLILLMIGRL